MGCHFDSLRSYNMPVDKNGETPTTRKMMGTVLPRRRPRTMPSCCKAGLGLGVGLLLVKLMFLSKKHVNALGEQPIDSVSRATHIGR